MKVLLFLWLTVWSYQVYCYGRIPKPKPGWQQPPQPSSEWSPSNPKPQWNPEPEWQEDSQPESEWQPPPAKPQWNPVPVWPEDSQPVSEWQPPPPPQWNPDLEWQEDSQPASEWQPPTPKPQWNPEPVWQEQPQPVSEWGPPKPENLCSRILANINLKEIETTPIVKTTQTYDSLYPCDSQSRIKRLTYETVMNNSRITCNGVTLAYFDDFYDATISLPNGKEITERLIIKNYTQINTYNSGNMNYLECGTIVGGKCSGDIVVGSGIFQAISQDGCCKGGNPGNVGVFRLIEIKGRCASKCSLGRSTHFFKPPVSNRGLANRILEEKESEKTDE